MPKRPKVTPSKSRWLKAACPKVKAAESGMSQSKSGPSGPTVFLMLSPYLPNLVAGLGLDVPSHNLSAYWVENRIGFIVVPPENSFLYENHATFVLAELIIHYPHPIIISFTKFHISHIPQYPRTSSTYINTNNHTYWPSRMNYEADILWCFLLLLQTSHLQLIYSLKRVALYAKTWNRNDVWQRLVQLRKVQYQKRMVAQMVHSASTN